MLILGTLMSAILEVVGILNSFCKFLENESRSEQTNYITFINSSWGICEQNMRVVIFWIMCHLSLGHEKKALLMKPRSQTLDPLPRARECRIGKVKNPRRNVRERSFWGCSFPGPVQSGYASAAS